MKVKSDTLGIDGNLQHFDSSAVRPSDAKATSVMNVEATVDVKPQELRSIRPFQLAIIGIPQFLKPEAQIVLQALLSCFEQKQSVQEGIIGDLLWGFAECGIPPECTLVGMKELDAQGYIRFQAPDNSWISMDSEHLGKCWVRYTQKLLDMVYSG
jgi:hypothetical protein